MENIPHRIGSDLVVNLDIDAQDMKKAAYTLKAYDRIFLSGIIYTARDAAHKRLCSLIEKNELLPFVLDGATIYYAGPTPAPAHLPIGSCGPTTSSRMDIFTPLLLDHSLSCMIGKGERNDEVIEAIKRNHAVYLCAIGGAGALACKAIKKAEVIAFDDLGCESVKRLTVERFPLIVAIDHTGGNIFDRKI